LHHACLWGLEALDKYYSLTDESYIGRFALLLNPNFKTNYMVKRRWQQAWINRALNLVCKVWKEEYTPAPTSASQPPTRPTTKPLFDFDEYVANGHTNEPAAGEVLDQLESYLVQDSFRCMDPLSYWHEKCELGKWPELAQMAIDYLSVPATSIDVEHAFLYGHQTVSLYRHSLSSESA
ncbi:hypothetical protein BOTBODRAFT_83167, partial [Botryobasidium botryosum FD-172 SS1]